MDTIDLKNLDSEQVEVYTYLTAEQLEVCEYLESLDIQEKYINDVLNDEHFQVYDSFENYVDDKLFQIDCELPMWIEIDYLETFKSMCMYSECKNFYFKNNPDFSSEDLREEEGLKEFERLLKFSKFVDIWGLEC